jgi:hypothetical protein
MRAPTLLLTAILLCVACDDGGDDGPRILRLVPGRAAPGDVVDVEGRGFGADGQGSVAIGGLPAPAETWAPDRVRIRLPADTPGGVQAVVVTVRGRPTAPATLEVVGGASRPDGPRHFPDGGPPPPDGGAADGGLPDAGEDLVAEYVPDPVGGGVALVPVSAVGGELRLEVRLPRGVPPLGGAAFHLAYDGNVLRFAGAEPADGERFLAKEIGAGRLAVGRILDGETAEPLATLRFRLVGRGEGRIEFPLRNRTLRDRTNGPLPAIDWSGGSIRVRSAP